MADAGERLKAALADHYRIERELGAGGMATVYLAQDLRHDRRVAVKVLRSDLAAALGPDRFLREVKIAANLQHPHVVPLYDSGQADDILYYVMPYIEGISLRQKLVREGELPIAEAVRILRDVADAMAYAHRHGVVHRDIKPENVMLAERHALVTDFGVAKAVSEATGRHTVTTAGVAVGTPNYMAPEQATADPHTDHRADIYAFGVLAYELLTGQPPFVGPTAQAVLAAHVTSAVEPVSSRRASVPPLLAALVMKCLEKRPADRWQSADDLIPELEAVLTPSGGMTPAETQAVAAVRGRRRPMAIALVVALALVGLVGARAILRRDTAANPNSKVLAVLPFENIGTAEDEYFADGMTEEITSRLGRVSGLAVIARTSTAEYKKTTKSPQVLADELQAGHILQGTVRWEKAASGPGRVRIAPRLIRSTDGVQVWSEIYEEAYGTGIFRIQASIAERVTEALRVALLAPEQEAVRAAPTSNVEAHDYYLRGRYYLERRLLGVWEDSRVALGLFQKAVELDSRFALAWAWLGRTHYRLLTTGADMSLPGSPTREARLRLAREAVERALSIDPALPEGHGTRSMILFATGDITAAERELVEVIRAQPSDPLGLIRHAWILLGREPQSEEAARMFARAAELDPRSAQTMSSVANGFWALGRMEDAARLYARATTLSPDDPGAYVVQAWFHWVAGEESEAGAALRKGIERTGTERLLFEVMRNSMYYRMLRAFDAELGAPARTITQRAFGLDTADYILTKAIAWRGDPTKAQPYWDSVGAWAAERIRYDSVETVYHLVRGLALANSGKGPEAVRTVADLPVRPPNIPVRFAYLAEVYVQAGALDQAIAALERWRAVDPMQMTARQLQRDPVWDPLREHPGFKKLLANSR